MLLGKLLQVLELLDVEQLAKFSQSRDRLGVLLCAVASLGTSFCCLLCEVGERTRLGLDELLDFLCLVLDTLVGLSDLGDLGVELLQCLWEEKGRKR